MKHPINTLRPRQDGSHLADDIFNIFHVWFPIKIYLKFVPRRLFNNIPALVHMMAWRRSGDKPLSVLMMVSLPTRICVTRPQWVKMHCNFWLHWRQQKHPNGITLEYPRLFWELSTTRVKIPGHTDWPWQGAVNSISNAHSHPRPQSTLSRS